LTSEAAVEPTATRIESSDGVTVVAHDYGGDGPPIVFCHATGFHGRYWDPICEQLSTRFRCITIDLRGHGDSSVPEGLDLVWDGMARDLLAVIDAFRLEDVHAVGHSMGGCAVLMAELARTGTIARAWLFDPTVKASSLSRILAANARRRQEVFPSRDAAMQLYQATPPFTTTDPGALRAYVDHGFEDRPDGRVVLKCRGEAEAQVYEFCPTDLTGRLSAINTEITIAGSGDGAPPARLAQRIAQRLAHATYEPHIGLSHLGPMQDPGQIAHAIAEALG
jgi:pimeloyl-ACP methyl ester carboxylesterase